MELFLLCLVYKQFPAWEVYSFREIFFRADSFRRLYVVNPAVSQHSWKLLKNRGRTHSLPLFKFQVHDACFVLPKNSSDRFFFGVETRPNSLTWSQSYDRVSYNASAVKIYNATSSLVRFENKIFYIEKTLRPTYHNAVVVVVYSKVVGFGPGANPMYHLRIFKRNDSLYLHST
jgi:hypothetical protein